MSTRAHNHAFLGIIALIFLTFIYGLTAVMARFFSDSIGIFEQWYLRFLIGTILMLIVFRHKINLKKFLHLSKKESRLVLARGFIGYVIAAGLYALSTQFATIGSVAVMQVVPMTALFGVLLLHERLSKKRLALIGVSFLGAVLVILQTAGQLHFGTGEALSLISAALFSLTFVLRKFQTGELNNYELGFSTLTIGLISNYLLAAFFEGAALPHATVFSPVLGVAFIGAGVLSVLMSLLSSYGFEHVKATTASVILDLELVFGILLGYLLYQELLTPLQLTGAVIILVSAIAMSYAETRKRSDVSLPTQPE